MKYYMYGDIYLRNDNWVQGYLEGINHFIEKHNGVVLSRSLNVERLEGDRELPTNVVLFEFPDRQSAIDFLEDPDYQTLRTRRINGSASEFVLFPSEDLVSVYADEFDAVQDMGEALS